MDPQSAMRSGDFIHPNVYLDTDQATYEQMMKIPDYLHSKVAFTTQVADHLTLDSSFKDVHDRLVSGAGGEKKDFTSSDFNKPSGSNMKIFTDNVNKFKNFMSGSEYKTFNSDGESTDLTTTSGDDSSPDASENWNSFLLDARNGFKYNGDLGLESVSDPLTKLPRGRPRTEKLPFLISQGNLSDSAIKCPICNRVFPRIKSLKAHRLTHLDELIYYCDYPACDRGFKQSGQLHNHIRTHTKEKPFVCPAEGCLTRHAHSNRDCHLHLKLKLLRVPENGSMIKQRFFQERENKSEEETKWIEEFLHKREQTGQKQQKRKDEEVAFDVDMPLNPQKKTNAVEHKILEESAQSSVKFPEQEQDVDQEPGDVARGTDPFADAKIMLGFFDMLRFSESRRQQLSSPKELFDNAVNEQRLLSAKIII